MALLKDDEGDASNLPPSSPRSEGPPDGIRVNLSGIDNSSQNNLERTFNVRDTARLGFEFGVLWVESILSCTSIPPTDFAGSSL